MLPVMVVDMGRGRSPGQARSIDLLAGQKLEYVRLGHAVVLNFSGGSQVLIETLARLDGPGGRVRATPPPDPMAPVPTICR